MKIILFLIIILSSCHAEETLSHEFTCGVDSRFIPFRTLDGKPFRWKKPAATYTFDKNVPQEIRSAVANAFNIWSATIEGKVIFIEREAGLVQIAWDEIGSLSTSFLGYTEIYTTSDEIIGGRITLNATDYIWHRGEPRGVGDQVPKRHVDIDGVALHETGHIFGLSHTELNNPGDQPTMYPVIYPGVENLHQDDIDGVRAIYDLPLLQVEQSEVDQVLILYKKLEIPYKFDLYIAKKPKPIVGVTVYVITVGNTKLYFKQESRKLILIQIGSRHYMRR